MIADATDLLDQSRIEWTLGEALFYAVRAQRHRGESDRALEHAHNAIALLEQSAPQRQSTPPQARIVGELYFLVGSLLAIHRSDHREAVVWYDKATPLLSENLAPLKSQAGLLGEQFVSMGVSYWETGDRKKAIQITQLGVQHMEPALAAGTLKRAALAVPFGNLATMYREIGNHAEAGRYAALVSQTRAAPKTKKR
jgi:tetratricopeptide (TPR) repeat protein